MMYYFYNCDRLEYSTPNKKELEWYITNNTYKNVRFYDINGRSIPFNSKSIVGTTNAIKVGTSLSKIVAAVNICGRQYYVGKGASLLKIMNHDDRRFDEVIMTDKGKKKVKTTFTLAR